ncbi:unnamed protein product [Candida verbasci]|uniref:Uncharacterized protein n=1 Tax=Candida verbasci TaxID=1227364 RepID=A0A9W4XKV1_9ASCO|nr:unnamed protein product [Candida verbasci]
MDESTVEKHITDQLYDILYPQYIIDKKLLYNWQGEIQDKFNDFNEFVNYLTSEIIINYNNSKIDTKKLLDIIKSKEIDNQKFKIIIYEIVINVIDSNIPLKLGLVDLDILDYLVDEFLNHLLSINQESIIDNLHEPINLLNQYFRLILSFSELGCKNKIFRKLFIPLLNRNANVINLVILQLLNEMFQRLNFPFILFSKQFNFPFQNDLKNTFTIYSWFKINLKKIEEEEEEEITLFTISCSFPDSDTTLRVKLINGQKFMIEIKNNVNGSRIQFTFNQTLSLDSNSNQGFTQFALTYDNFTNLNLFVNGEYSESIPCPDLHKFFKKWNKISINDEKISNELTIRNLTLLNINLNFEWINLLYNLGIVYDWDFKEFNHDTLKHLLNQMNYQNLFTTSSKINDYEIQKDSKNQKRTNRKDKNSQIELMNKNYIIKSLQQIKNENILFDSNEYFQHLTLQNQKSTTSLKFHNPNNLYSIFNLIGGSAILLKILEISLSTRDSKLRDLIFCKSLNLLLTILSNDWRSNKEFENFNGYGILSLLLQKYKILNPTLKFDVLDIEEDNDLLHMLLKFTGHNYANLYESAITNSLCYKLIILNFDLFYKSKSFEYLLFQIQLLLTSSKYKNYNYLELKHMRLLKKLIHFLKSNKDNLSKSTKFQLSQTLASILKLDTSVEAITTTASYVIYALYNPESSTECGVIALQVLTDCLCDPNTPIKTLKKFSRSVTVHWILLLFKFDHDQTVVGCGIKLLTRLLKILGSHIIRKFFQINHGLDILTSFLKDWWNNDEILCLIFLASFGIDVRFPDSKNLVEVVNSLDQSSQLILPEFILLLNNLVLNSLNTLSLESGNSLGSSPSTPNRDNKENVTLTLDVLHLIYQHTESLKVGYERITSLHKLYQTKPFLESLVEILGYLKISLTWSNNPEVQKELKLSFENLSNVIAGFYISNLSDDHFLNAFHGLSDFTKLTLLDLIFPKVIDHINQFINVTNFVFNEKQIVNNTIQILNYYNNDLIQKNYWITHDNLDIFILCSITLIEIGVGNTTSLKRNLGNIIVAKFLKLSCDYEFMLNETTKNLNNILKELLYRQVTVFNREILNNKQISDIIKVLLGIFFIKDDSPNTEMPFNFLRTCYLIRDQDFNEIIQFLNVDNNLIIEFFNNLVSKNDSETLSRLNKYPPFVKDILKEFNKTRELFSNTEPSRISSMISITLKNGGKLSQLNNIYIKSFEKDCESIKISTMNNELTKYNRLVQDNEESIKYCISNYHSLKFEITRLFDNNYHPSYMLDYIENSDRMRKRLIIEDQLPESEKLTYNIEIPLQKIDTLSESDYEYINGVDTLSLTNDTGDDDYEFIKRNDDDLPDLEDINNFEDKNRKVSRSLFVGDQIVALWNISQINGLVPVESLLILGINHIYLIENYFLSKDGNVVDVDDAPPELRDPVLQLVNSQSSNILKNNEKSHRNKNWSLENLSCISKRQFLLRDNALEMFFKDGASILITCMSQKERDLIYSKLYSFATGKGIDYDLSQALQGNMESFSSKLASAFTQPSSLLNATKRWKMGEMSNFYYLMIINTLAGRTFNDLTQYPVFPWVIADYTSETLDLSNPKTFRDLSKPMGGQTPNRANQFHERFEALNSLDDDNSPAFHYGTHYSSAMIVTSFLIRLKPYVQSYLLLQGGKFDHADRLFNSIEKAWFSASKDNTTDVRELTPEFYYLPEFLINSNNFEFGKLQNGISSNNVELPPWAKNDPKIFIDKNREALESPYVSANLHLWIDLIFGFKQDGIEAINSLNVFHHLSYNGAINLDNINDEMEKRAVIGMINNFGQTPKKLFNKPHVMRDVLNLPNYYLTKLSNKSQPLKLVFESKIKQPIVKLEISARNNNRWVGRQACISCEDELLIRKYKTSNRFLSGSIVINDVIFLNIHSCDITTLVQIGHKTLVSGSDNGMIYVWKCEIKPKISLHYQAVLRGHLCGISKFVYSKSFKSGVSLDYDGIVIIWDLTRYKFIKKIIPTERPKESLIAISNDSGNIAILHTYETTIQLQIFTINGEIIIEKSMDVSPSVIGFGSSNLLIVENNKSPTLNNHIFWSNEIFAIAKNKTLELWELTADSEKGWILKELESIVLSNELSGDITSFEIFKTSEIDGEDNLTRGVLKLVIGDSKGKVYTL